MTEKLPRPGHIWVYDFAAAPAEVPAASSLAGQPIEHAKPLTTEEIELGRKLGGAIAADIVEEISGSAKIEGRGKETAKEIAEMIKPKFQEQGWIN